jgi:YD repeat-containing protein
MAKRFTEEALGALSMAGKEQSATLQQQLNEISRQAELLQESLSATTTELSAKSDALSEALISGQKELKDGLFETAEKGNENVSTAVAGAVTSLSENLDLVKQSTFKSLEFLEKNKQNMGDLFNKIIALQSHNTGISSSINNALASKESILKALNEKSAVLQKEINKTYFQAQNLENLISRVPTKNKEIVESIKAVIRTEIKSLISNSVSELNDEILSSQIVQESVNNELSKLQILLRTILKSFDNYSELLKDQTIKNLGTGSQVADRTKLGPSKSPVQSLLNKEPNRTETIVDDESGNVVLYHYKNGDLIKTTMKDKQNRTIYELEYINGRIQRSKNYDTNGKLSIEQTFHNNGQVHYRIEYTKKGKITSEFDNNGNKK